MATAMYLHAAHGLVMPIAGAVHVVYGRAGGLDKTDVDIWREALGTIPGQSEAGDGWSDLDSPSG